MSVDKAPSMEFFKTEQVSLPLASISLTPVHNCTDCSLLSSEKRQKIKKMDKKITDLKKLGKKKIKKKKLKAFL